ncbi:hypothetical protein TWF102_007477 [Orbilia oligospora]|uniref:Uncharacterized protein n=1 Tax=Orbilia oligospora TaxID=2813651 RepID=A0A7C8NAI3_ORBOL|nr:hypothetical protein TWF102_007477 [Orbilia oligospora]
MCLSEQMELCQILRIEANILGSCRWVALVPGKTRRHVLQYQEFSEASSSVLRKAIVQDSLATIHGYIRTTRDAGWSRSIVRGSFFFCGLSQKGSRVKIYESKYR